MANRYVNPYRVMLGECTRKEIREALQRGELKAAIIPIGATEQHNEHLSLDLDIVLSTFISQQAALRLYPQVTVAPPCPVGYSPYHMARKGTLTLRKETMQAYIFDVAQSLKTHGIRTILVVNGHGGNHGLLREVLPAWRQELGITMDEESYWMGLTAEDKETILQGYRDLRDGKLDTVARQTALNHASEDETSVMLAACPQRVRALSQWRNTTLPTWTTPIIYRPKLRHISNPFPKKGWPQGGPNPENPRDRARQENALLATVEKGEALITIHVQYVANKLQKMIDATEKGQS